MECSKQMSYEGRRVSKCLAKGNTEMNLRVSAFLKMCFSLRLLPRKGEEDWELKRNRQKFWLYVVQKKSTEKKGQLI